MSSLITTHELRKTFQMGRQKVHALDNVDLTVAANTFYTVMGPSGSGKSTLLYLLGGLDRPSSGQIHVNGDSLEAMDENALAIYRRRTIGFIFQSFNLIPSLSALENVAYPLRFSGVSRRRRQAIARDLLQRVGLEVTLPVDLLALRVHRLRAGAALAIGARRPPVLAVRGATSANSTFGARP